MPTTTIYEKQMWADQQQRLALEQQRLQQQDRADKSFDQSMQQAKFDADETDRDFQRRAKLAELYGKAAAQEGKSGADRMTDPGAQELADVNYRLEKQRVPNMKREADARFGYKMGLEREKDDRLGAQLSVRQMLAQQHEKNAMEVAHGKQVVEEKLARIAQAKLALEQLKSPLERMKLQGEIDRQTSDAHDNIAQLAKMTSDAYAHASKVLQGELGSQTPESYEFGMRAAAVADFIPRLAASQYVSSPWSKEDPGAIYREMQQHIDAMPLSLSGAQNGPLPDYAQP